MAAIIITGKEQFVKAAIKARQVKPLVKTVSGKPGVYRVASQSKPGDFITVVCAYSESGNKAVSCDCSFHTLHPKSKQVCTPMAAGVTSISAYSKPSQGA